MSVYEKYKFFVFSADNSRKFVAVWAIYLSTHDSYRVIAENGMVNSLWTYLFVRYSWDKYQSQESI